MNPVARGLTRMGGRRFILALGGAYTLVGVAWPAVGTADLLQVNLIISILVGGAGLTLLYGGYQLTHADIHPEFFATVAGWCVRGIVVMVSILVFIALVADLNNPAANFLILPALAAVAGFGAGRHDARAQTRTYELEMRNQELQQTQAELEDAVDKLAESQQRYRTVTENFPNGGVALLDTNLRHTLIAGQGFEKLDFSAGDLRGERVQDIYSGEVLEVIERNYGATLDGEARTFEETHGQTNTPQPLFCVAEGSRTTAISPVGEERPDAERGRPTVL